MAEDTSQALITYDWIPRLDIVSGHLLKLAAESTTFVDLLKKCVVEVVIPSIQANFDAKGRPGWAPYADSTIEFHKMLGESMGTLLDLTGALRGTMASPSIWTFSNTEASLGGLPQSVWYGNLHQVGNPGSNLPARPFVLLQDSDLQKIDKIFGEWLDERIEIAWPGI